MSTAQPPTIDAVEFYWRPGCGFCRALHGSLTRAQVPLRDVNIWDDPTAASRVRAVARGNETVPTVFVGDHVLVNPTRKAVLALVAAEAPHLLADEPGGDQPGIVGWLRSRIGRFCEI